ncbi:hypothetical protein DFJ74DRAFT_690604 [Hyaloraphidium curvatum]|nr:hypothetical protein DFJ74DRAFT_690604 [Hyaloraphidium curvatum]
MMRGEGSGAEAVGRSAREAEGMGSAGGLEVSTCRGRLGGASGGVVARGAAIPLGCCGAAGCCTTAGCCCAADCCCAEACGCPTGNDGGGLKFLAGSDGGDPFGPCLRACCALLALDCRSSSSSSLIVASGVDTGLGCGGGRSSPRRHRPRLRSPPSAPRPCSAPRPRLTPCAGPSRAFLSPRLRSSRSSLSRRLMCAASVNLSRAERTRLSAEFIFSSIRTELGVPASSR